ncbi:MAG: CusA/CzcA family heavy metal efflux RND transporter [Cytophagaceae bacterium]|nr:CusA/CzcA family heavy metal efflux RND transporter [Cytophagaceae bacterium]MDW8456037.1 CusA/CzcA family heavy metal efflux RND transporter [Cytophagaceae bacterium]
MTKFIKNILSFSLLHKPFTFFWVTVLVVAGVIAFRNMPIEAFPDVTNTQIIIVTDWNGRSAEEIERFVTTPIEIAMNSVQKKTSVRSITMFGLSVIKIIFEDDVEDFFARQQVNNLLKNVSLPEGVIPEVQPPYGPTGEVFRYVLKSKKRDTRDLLTIQNWVIDRHLRAVPGVADLVAFGGQEKIYEVSVDPNRLSKYDVTPLEVFDAVNKSNLNVGGDVIEKNNQAFVVRGVGMIDDIKDIQNIIVKQEGGVPVLVKDLADVAESSMPRVGQVGLDDNDDIVEGIVVMRKGENPKEVLARVKSKIHELNNTILPADVKIETFYDRDNLMNYTTATVMHNMIEGIIFVTVIVFIFMADWRTTLIVSMVIPLSLLFAFLCLKLKGMSANLLSLGAVDFGIIIDGAVVMVEGIFVALDQLSHKRGMPAYNKLSKAGLIKKTGAGLGKSIFFSKLIIIIALLPIFAFQKVEGKMFSPLAYTLAFALLGALIFTLTLVPVLCHVLLNKNVKEKNNPFVRFIERTVEQGFKWTFSNKLKTLTVTALFLIITFGSTVFLGTEFLPQLNEGALWVTAELPISYSQKESAEMANILRKELKKFPEVKQVLSQEGRSNDGTDPNGFNFLQFQVDLKPKSEWGGKSIDDIVNEMDKNLSQIQGITYNYSQPIIDNVAEAAAGIKASNAIKIYGEDLNTLDKIANQVMKKIEKVPGVKDVGILRNLGQPEITVKLDREKMAAYGVQIADAQAVLEMAFGGKTATQKFEGEKKFDVRIRYQKDYRKSETDITNLKVPTISGLKIPLKEIADIHKNTGPAFIYRDNTQRFIGVKFSVRDRDLGSTIRDAQREVDDIELPEGYNLAWTGEFENQVRATDTLMKMVPLSLIGIFVLLFITFASVKDSLIVICNVPFAVTGGIIALHMTGINFGISAGVGFIALFGICVQNGVILVSQFEENLKLKMKVDEAIFNAVKLRTRPVVMTALMASIGLLPAAISTGIGSESQKPLAVVIIGGLVTSTFLTLLVFPIVFWIFNRTKKELIE